MRLFIVAAICLFASTGRVEAQTKSIDEIKIEKVGLDFTVKELQKLHPRAELADDEHNPNVPGFQMYRLIGVGGNCNTFFRFLDGKLASITIHWTPEGLKEDGGHEPIVEKLIKKYGKPDLDGSDSGKKTDPVSYFWKTEASSLTVFYSSKHGLMIGAHSNKVQDQLDKLKKKSK